MSWVRHDDGADEHPKIAILTSDAFRLWYNGLCYCARQLTDGYIPLFQVRRLLPGVDHDRLIAELTTPQVPDRAPLWELTADAKAVQVHDYLVYNKSASEVRGTRAAAQARMTVGRQLKQLGAGDRISLKEWEKLPADLQVHFAAAEDGSMHRQRGMNAFSPSRFADCSAEQRPNFGRTSAEVQLSRPDPTRPLKKEEEPPVVPRERGTPRAVEPGDRVARWAAVAKRPRGLAPKILEAAVVRCLREIRQAQVEVGKCSTAAAGVLSLWRALDRPDVHAFADDLTLVARAAQMSSEKLFARDVRAEGWPEGTDRMLHVATICRHDKWDDRLRAAQLWARTSGRVRDDGIARAKRGRWLDPYDSCSWRIYPEPVPVMELYVQCARRLLEDELGADDLRAALGRLDSLANLKGSSEEVTAIVRFALDEVGKW